MTNRLRQCLSAALAMLLMLTLCTACNSAATYENYISAEQKTAALGDLSLLQVYSGTLMVDGELSEILASFKFKKITDEEDEYLQVEKYAFAQDVETATTAFYTEGVAYLDENGVKTAQTMTADEMLSLLDVRREPTLPAKEDCRNFASVEEGESTRLTFTISGDSVRTLWNESGLFEEAAESLQIEAVEASALITESGYLKELTAQFKGTLTVDETAAQFDVTMTRTLEEKGDDVTISWPDEEYLDGDGVTDTRLALAETVRGELFDDDGNYVADEETVYTSLCERYTQAEVDWAIDYIRFKGENMSREQFHIMWISRYTLYDENGDRLEDFDALYVALCEKYGEEAVRWGVDYLWIGGEELTSEEFELVREVFYTLYDEDGQPLENADELYEEMKEKYGAEKVEAALNYLVNE